MLSIENVDLSLGNNTKLERKILNDFNFNIKEGEFVVVIGGNGAGKSTFFNIISGALKPDSGKIVISGEDVTNKSQEYRSKYVSKVMQDPKMGSIENMTIFENMAFAYKRGQKRGFELFQSSNRIELFRDKLSILNIGLENRMDEFVSNLSGGQRQALSIAMAMLQDSKLLLLDEITAAIDPPGSDNIMSITNDIIRAQSRTSIMITHDMKHAIKYGDRLLLLKKGKFAKEFKGDAKSCLTISDLAAEF